MITGAKRETSGGTSWSAGAGLLLLLKRSLWFLGRMALLLGLSTITVLLGGRLLGLVRITRTRYRSEGCAELGALEVDSGRIMYLEVGSVYRHSWRLYST